MYAHSLLLLVLFFGLQIATQTNYELLSPSKGNDMTDKKPKSTHEEFQLGSGYGSAERGSDAESHKSKKQFGDNPLPKSGGGYSKAGVVQPKQEPTAPDSGRKHHHP